MTKREKLLIVLFSVFLFAVGLLVFLSSEQIEKKPSLNLKILNIQAWDEKVYSIVPPPTEDGNAASYFLEAIHFARDGSKLSKKYSWWRIFSKHSFKELLQWKNGNSELKAIMEDALNVPEIDSLVNGSNQKNYSIYGAYYTPSPNPEISIYEDSLIEYLDLLKLAQLMVIKAFYMLENGNTNEAEKYLFATLRMAHLLQKDSHIVGNYVGVKIESITIKEISGFYKMAGRNDTVELWGPLLNETKKRKEAWWHLYNNYLNLDKRMLMKIVDDKTLPRAIRLQSLKSLASNTLKTKVSTVMGIPDDIKEFISSKHFDDTELYILQLKLIDDIDRGRFSSIKKRFDMRGPIFNFN